jgi:ribosomal protein L11 methyltransferase
MLALVVTVARLDVELASDALWSLGVVAIEEREAGDEVELWTSLGDDADAVADAAAEVICWPWRCVEVDERVAETWRQFAEPARVDTDLVVCPAWVAYTAPAGETVVRIEPGATFGLGDHPTTILSIRALRAAATPGASVLDVGCGSGVLAIAACMFGAAHAAAIDISPAAVPVTQHNAALNGVGGQVTASTTSLADVVGRYDIVVANILAPTLIDLAEDLQRVLAPSGVLIISGVLADRHDHVEAALHTLHRIDRTTDQGWAAVTLTRRPLSGR